ncbi:PRC-barrel domain-containing protein [Nocardia sp. MH4]|nr:PRC-barrel domain-containing protein [Nocardia sp. MH4]
MSRATLDSLIGATAYDERGEKIGKVKHGIPTAASRFVRATRSR